MQLPPSGTDNQTQATEFRWQRRDIAGRARTQPARPTVERRAGTYCDDGAGDEARHPQQNIRRRDLGGKHALGCAMRSMAGFRCRDQDMALIEKAVAGLRFHQPRMPLSHHAQITVRKQPLPPQIPGGLRECAQRQIRLARFKLQFELPGIQRHRPHADIRCNRRNACDQRRQKPDHADVGQQQTEHPIGCLWDRTQAHPPANHRRPRAANATAAPSAGLSQSAASHVRCGQTAGPKTAP